jgi:hypothetical protein
VDTSTLSFDVPGAQDVQIIPPDELDAMLQSEERESSSQTEASNAKDEEIFIRTTYHPRRGRPDTLVSLDQMVTEVDATADPDARPSDTGSFAWNHPWAPFSCRADFEAAEHMTKHRMSNGAIDEFLKPLGPRSGALPDDEHRPGYQPAYVWHIGRSLITMRNASDYHNTMARAREYILKACVHVRGRHPS